VFAKRTEPLARYRLLHHGGTGALSTTSSAQRPDLKTIAGMRARIGVRNSRHPINLGDIIWQWEIVK
jgi:hypothetical protein